MDTTGGLGLRVFLFDGADLVLRHVHRGEHEVDVLDHVLDVGHVLDDHVLDELRHRGFHLPAAADGLLIGFASAACAGRKGNQIKPGMIFQQRNKALADHTGCTDNTNIVLFHPD